MIKALVNYIIEDIVSIDRDDLIVFALLASICLQVVVYFLLMDQYAALPLEGY